MAKCLRVEKQYSERIIELMRDINGIDESYEFDRDEEFLYIPVRKAIAECSEDYDIVDRRMKKKGKPKPKSLKDYLLGKGYTEYTRAFDIIGEIAIVEVPEGIAVKDIADGILSIYNNIKCVYAKGSAREGDFRLYELNHIGGEELEETTHTENGVRMLVNVKKAFFSPRTANDRQEIAELLSRGKARKIMVFFAGIGPFSLVGAKLNPDKEFVGIELNPDAVDLFKRNIELNKFTNVKAVLGDVKELARDYSGFDAVIMPLPRMAHLFLSDAVKVLSNKGLIIAYMFTKSDGFEARVERAIEENLPEGTEFRILEIKKTIDYSPEEVKVRVIVQLMKQE